MKNLKILFIVVLSLFILASCGKQKKKKVKPKTTPVSVLVAKKQNVKLQYKSTGSIVPIVNPVIKAEIRGPIYSVNVHTGEKVKIGQALAVMNNRAQKIAYQQAQAELNSAKAMLKEKTLASKSNAELANKQVISKLAYAKVVASEEVAIAKVKEEELGLLHAQHNLDKTIIRSPIDGFVEKVLVHKGGYVSVGTPMFKLINNKVVQARLPFSQERAGQFKIGQEVHLLSPATPGKEYIGQITAITPSIDPLNRSLHVIVSFNSDNNVWHSGASIEGFVYVKDNIPAFVLPVQSIVRKHNNTYVFVINKQNKAEQRKINILQENSGIAKVTGNLKDGDNIVDVGAQYISKGTLVKIQKSS